MLKDRGYSIPKHLLLDYDTFKTNISDNLRFTCKDIGIQITTTFKIKSSTIRSIVLKMKKEFDCSQVIIVLKQKPSSLLIKLTKEYPLYTLQLFGINELQFNISKHILVPKHILINNDNVDTILKTYNIHNVKKLPLLLRTDPIVRYFAYLPNSVIRIERPSVTGGDYVSYRCVV